jgi:multimeric flavodoxin WrbA
MKVIGIVGSPRKNGNTDTLVQAVLDGAKEAGHETAKYSLNEMKYSGCQGCGYCKNHEECRQDDDVSKLLQDMRQAGAVVFGSPIYFGQFTGQFRLMEDRMYSLIDTGFKSRLSPGKKAVIVISQGNPDVNAFDGAVQDFARVLGMLGFEVIETIKMANGNRPDSVKERPDLLEKAKAAGKSL